jgi:hypothetical protein
MHQSLPIPDLLLGFLERRGCCFPNVAVMEAANPRQGSQERGVGLRLRWPSRRSFLVQAKVGPVVMKVCNELTAETADVGFIDRDLRNQNTLGGHCPPTFSPFRFARDSGCSAAQA